MDWLVTHWLSANNHASITYRESECFKCNGSIQKMAKNKKYLPQKCNNHDIPESTEKPQSSV